MSTQATETPMRLTIDLSKPKGQRETLVPFSAEEIAQAEKESTDYLERKALEEAEAQDRADAKASGVAKLSALGLSDAEIAAITGA